MKYVAHFFFSISSFYYLLHGSPQGLSLTKTVIWNEINCTQRHGLIIGYTVMISNDSDSYLLTTTETRITLNDMVSDTEYNISVAAINSFGRGPFSDPILVEFETGICMWIKFSF